MRGSDSSSSTRMPSSRSRSATESKYGDRGRGAGHREKAVQYGRVGLEEASEQGSPREVDGELVGEPGKLGRKGLGGCHHEKGVGEAALSVNAPGGLDHRGSVRVDADHQKVWIGSRTTKDEPAVTGTEVDGPPGISGGELGELTDV